MLTHPLWCGMVQSTALSLWRHVFFALHQFSPPPHRRLSFLSPQNSFAGDRNIPQVSVCSHSGVWGMQETDNETENIQDAATTSAITYGAP
jgi:hypothetical protein